MTVAGVVFDHPRVIHFVDALRYSADYLILVQVTNTSRQAVELDESLHS